MCPSSLRVTGSTLAAPFSLTFEHDAAPRGHRVTCKFWNFSKLTNDLAQASGGSWDTSGCLTSTNEDRVTTCQCTHFTHFAALFTREAPGNRDMLSQADEQRLTFITYIGVGISSILLILTLLAFARFRRLVGAPACLAVTVPIVALSCFSRPLLTKTCWSTQ